MPVLHISPDRVIERLNIEGIAEPTPEQIEAKRQELELIDLKQLKMHQVADTASEMIDQ